MISDRMFEGLRPEDHVSDFAYTVHSLTRVARLALANEASGDLTDEVKCAAVEVQMEVIEAMLSVVIDGAEVMERRLGLGRWGGARAGGGQEPVPAR